MQTRPRPLSGTVALLAAVVVGALAPRPALAQPLELVFTSGSEKKEWLAAVTADYLKTNPMADGKPVKITLIPMGSGECMDAVRDPEKWEKTSEAEVKRVAEELKRVQEEVAKAEEEAKANPADAAKAQKLADVKKREAGVKKAEARAAETKLAARAHLTSPASRAFIRMANAECKATNQKPVVDPGREEDSLVKSAVVIAMWEDMAKALGWPDKEVGWGDIYTLAQDPKGWNGKFPGRGWGRFKFGHTHPELSNSGLLAVLAEAYYGADKSAGLTVDDIAAAKVGQKMAQIEQTVLFYGQSTGFFGDAMVSGGPDMLSAGILYEDQVIKANDPKNKLPQRLVAIYPAEGTFMSDHPVGVVEREWVTKAHREAAEAYIEFLRQKAQQTKAMEFGFRPGVKLPLDADKFNDKNGVDAKQPRANPLDVPSAEVMKEIVKLWGQVRKPLRVALVIDTSKSMVHPDKQKFAAAKAAAEAFVEKLTARDELTLLPFNSPAHEWAIEKPLKMDAAGKKEAVEKVRGLRADYQTGLYDAVSMAHDQIKAEKRGEFTTAVVVLSDGEDYGDNLLVERDGKKIAVESDPKGTVRPRLPTDKAVNGPDGKPVKLGSLLSLDELLEKVKFDPEGAATRVFTIAYGSDADPVTLDKIAKRTRAVMYPSTPGDIDRVIQLILRDQ